MKQITLTMEESLYNFYKKVGQQAGGLSPEKVMSDALFKLAGELALNALHKKSKRAMFFLTSTENSLRRWRREFSVCLLGERENHIRNGSFVQVKEYLVNMAKS